MLSSQSTNLHRRQNSTPVVTDVQKVSLAPANIQPQGSQRRGLSLDRLIQPQPQRLDSLQDNQGNRTNQDLQIIQQQILREAQQHRLARPGQQQWQQHLENFTPGKIDQIKSYREPGQELCNDHREKSTTDTAEQGKRSTVFDCSQNEDLNLLPSLNSISSVENLDGFGLGLHGINGDVQEGRAGEPVDTSSMLPDSVVYDDVEIPHRPHTPPNQFSNSYLMTPATTPFSKTSRALQAPQSRTAQSSPTREDQNATIKASRSTLMQRGTSCQDIFKDRGRPYCSPDMPSPPYTAPLMPSSTFNMESASPTNIMNMSNLNIDFPSSENGYESSQCSPMSKTLSSFQSSPEFADIALFPDADTDMTDFPVSFHSHVSPSSRSTLDLGHASCAVRDVVVSKSQSIADLNLDQINASIEDTGVTIDEIASFIEGPDDKGKWTCRYPECEKKFGRKENIKSHVQTHLGDRQFRCNVCFKCFVRHHDLKRHSKTHSGIKDFPCACGQSFARQDALTRHRQRGTCIGAFDGIMKKPIKRGRPSKRGRPEDEERLEKAARTREKVLERKYASSVSGSSECSFPSPKPAHTNLIRCETSSLENLEVLDTFGIAPDMFTYTPPASPGYSMGNCVSPHQILGLPSPRKASISSILGEAETDMWYSPSKSSASQYGTPPELDLSSSPAASKFFDFDGGSEAVETNDPAPRPTLDAERAHSPGLLGTSQEINQVLFDAFGHSDSLTDLEKDPNLLLDKVDNPFGMNNQWADELGGGLW